MSLAADLGSFEVQLNNAIKEMMETDVADAVKDEISHQLGQYSFPHSRGENGMGLIDKRNFEAKVEPRGDTITLTVEDVAMFQNDRGTPGQLAEVVTKGDSAYHMPGPRPFMQSAQEAMNAWTFEQVLAAGLQKRGFGDAIGALALNP